ncbi:30S ribosomal protein S3 [Striga asiatica]|uniref:30S ribosomal protein S3 n=1 Tax=Striga asiatica TaxID=4170 RepID=A0A5A7PV78_STRAF|nr:30S ribosomal protein S3 [Striga asiatica]
MKKAIELADTKGIRIQISGRIGGKEIARVVWITAFSTIAADSISSPPEADSMTTDSLLVFLNSIGTALLPFLVRTLSPFRYLPPRVDDLWELSRMGNIETVLSSSIAAVFFAA